MEISYRDGTRADAPAIIEFQRAMARETEDLELDAATVTRGVHGVFDDPSPQSTCFQVPAVSIGSTVKIIPSSITAVALGSK